MEVLLRVIPPKLFTQIYSDCFYKRLLTLACHPKANFAVQKLIQFSNEKTEVSLNKFMMKCICLFVFSF